MSEQIIAPLNLKAVRLLLDANINPNMLDFSKVIGLFTEEDLIQNLLVEGWKPSAVILNKLLLKSYARDECMNIVIHNIKWLMLGGLSCKPTGNMNLSVAFEDLFCWKADPTNIRIKADVKKMSIVDCLLASVEVHQQYDHELIKDFITEAITHGYAVVEQHPKPNILFLQKIKYWGYEYTPLSLALLLVIDREFVHDIFEARDKGKLTDPEFFYMFFLHITFYVYDQDIFSEFTSRLNLNEVAGKLSQTSFVSILTHIGQSSITPEKIDALVTNNFTKNEECKFACSKDWAAFYSKFGLIFTNVDNDDELVAQ
jgi:hypothetical protein